MRLKRVFCVFLICVFLIGLLSACKMTEENTEDISDLQISDTSQICELIDFETAVKIESKVSETIDRYAEEKLKELENEILAQEGSSVNYYQFIGTFSVMSSAAAIEEAQGTMISLIIVADAPQPYIYEVRTPVTEFVGNQTVKWNNMDASSSIHHDKTSVRIAAMGYLTVMNDEQSENASNTLYPAFEVSLF